MNRRALIAIGLCALLLGTIGAGVVAAKQTENPRHAGASSIYFYDVKATDTHGTGKLMINTRENTFVFNGKGFDPNTLYVLQYRATSSGTHVFASGRATPSGNLHITGTWAKDATLPTAPGFGVSIGSGAPITIKSYATDEYGAYYLLSAPFWGGTGYKTHAYLGSLPTGLVGGTFTATLAYGPTFYGFLTWDATVTMPSGQVYHGTVIFYDNAA